VVSTQSTTRYANDVFFFFFFCCGICISIAISKLLSPQTYLAKMLPLSPSHQAAIKVTASKPEPLHASNHATFRPIKAQFLFQRHPPSPSKSAIPILQDEWEHQGQATPKGRAQQSKPSQQTPTLSSQSKSTVKSSKFPWISRT
jgi:hypothetical protein